jgi:hypothetical protein
MKLFHNLSVLNDLSISSEEEYQSKRNQLNVLLASFRRGLIVWFIVAIGCSLFIVIDPRMPLFYIGLFIPIIAAVMMNILRFNKAITKLDQHYQAADSFSE